MPRFERNARAWIWPCIAVLSLFSIGACHKKKAVTDSVSVDQPHPPDTVPGATPLATLERTGCYGECPVYRLTVGTDGSVVYVGTRWVKVLGRQEYKLSAAQLGELQSAFERANFLQLRDYDRVESTDDDWAHLSFRRGAGMKRVRHYHGDNSAPATLTALEDDFDRIVDSARFVGTAGASTPTAPAAGQDREPGTAAGPAKSADPARNNIGAPEEAPADPDEHP